jgi:hypothetical protein
MHESDERMITLLHHKMQMVGHDDECRDTHVALSLNDRSNLTDVIAQRFIEPSGATSRAGSNVEKSTRKIRTQLARHGADIANRRGAIKYQIRPKRLDEKQAP